MLLGRICTSCNNNFLTLWERCFNWGGVLLGIVCMLYNMMDCMAVVYDAEEVMRCYDAKAMMQCYDTEAMMQFCGTKAMM